MSGMHRRLRRGAGVGLALMALAACGDGDSPSATPPAAPSTSTSDPPSPAPTVAPVDVPPVVVVTDAGPSILRDGRLAPYDPVPPDGAGTVEVVHVLDDATAAVQVRLDETGGGASGGEPRREVRVIQGGEARALDLGPSPVLHDVGTVDGRPVVLATHDVGGLERSGRLVLVDVASGDETELGEARAIEYEVAWASLGGDLVVTTAYADLTEVVAFLDPTGAERALPSPTDDLAYNAPPLVVAAALSADGTELAWAEGPDSAGPEGEVDGTTWEVVVSPPGGEPTGRVIVPGAGPDQLVVRLDVRDGWVLVSVADVDREGVEAPSPSATWLLHPSSPGVAPSALPEPGTATFVG